MHPSFIAIQKGHPSEIIDYILDNFHTQHRLDLAKIITLSEKVESVHHDHPQCPHGLTQQVKEIQENLLSHMYKEENILFPMMKEEQNQRNFQFFPQMPLKVMMMEHEDHKKDLLSLKKIALQFSLPENACGTWRSLYALLLKFSQDIEQHIDLENNYLFQYFLQQETVSLL